MTEGPEGLHRYLAERRRITESGWTQGAGGRLCDLMSAAVLELAGELPAGVAVVATGGFGRGVMAVASDVDLLFLHSGRGEEEVARRILRPLWDARIKVGHLTHTPRSARQFAGTRLDAISTFLSARLLGGDGAVFEDFRERFARLLEKEHSRIVRMMADEERRRRDEEPYRLMAADLKNGRGGIRTVDLLDWRRRLLAAHRAPVPTADPREEELRAGLTKVRSALHVASGRLHDRYDFELRDRAARWLGTDVASLGEEVLTMRSLAEGLVDEWWPEVGARGRPDGSLVERTRPGRRGDLVWWWTSGQLAGFAELERLLNVPHLVPFHRYPVADHTLAAVDRAWSLLGGEVDDPVVREVVAGLERPELLVLAALFHDTGKGARGDHARAGASETVTALPRLGLDTADGEVLVRLVEHHLLLADLATKFDHDDPAVLAWAADRIVDRRTLRLLFLLTVVDSQATGSDTWSPWRAELLRRSYRRMERELTRRSMPEEARVAVLADRVVEASAGALGHEEVVAHLSGLTDIYRTSHSPSVISEHVLLSRRPLGPGGGLVTTSLGTPTRIVVMALDRPRLLLDVAGVLALNNMSIIDARFATRSDGRVFDTFEVVDAVGGEITSERAAKVESELERTLRGGFDVDRELSAKRRAYRHLQRPGVEPHVTVDRLDSGGGRIEVECADRVGLVRGIAEVFSDFGMPITRARVDTRGGVAYDTFLVTRLPADPEPLIAAMLAALE